MIQLQIAKSASPSFSVDTSTSTASERQESPKDQEYPCPDYRKFAINHIEASHHYLNICLCTLLKLSGRLLQTLDTNFYWIIIEVEPDNVNKFIFQFPVMVHSHVVGWRMSWNVRSCVLPSKHRSQHISGTFSNLLLAPNSRLLLLVYREMIWTEPVGGAKWRENELINWRIILSAWAWSQQER